VRRRQGASPEGRSLPRLHVVTDDSMLARGGWKARAAEVLATGASGLCLHLRGPRTDGATLYRLASELISHAHIAGAQLVVNDRLDVALALRMDGVHLAERSLPVAASRALLGADPWLGVSRHDAAEIAAAVREGADYAFLGTIFATPTHPGVVGMGLEGLSATLSGLGGFPVLGIGGIDPERVAGVLHAGAHGVAVVRGVWDARDPVSAVRCYLEAIEEAIQR